ncbi:DUF5333 family protein [Jannaschia ovalis]|uniref:DUF5333 family protein n=1 Tax=Jannaschia ovalis TaxID=3038773 RepID=A0ABY8L8G5_9RHOB|nr:DUF5333 family protein [Jannaschia sp. GRR-S6-38]WGH77652.1 DUF5333 family protein [Jannaschia sp. GRR-S6-38]
MRAAALILLAAPAAAQEAVPAPDYFVEAAFLSSTAQVLALSCQTLSVDPIAIARLTDATLARLTEDGFTPENLADRMADPSDAIATLQAAFVQKHALEQGAPEAAVCAAGAAEIAEETALGTLIVEVAQ